jgi:UDP-N-acetylmuramate-alanine ligase
MESYLDIVSYLMRQADPKTLILTMGAGEMDKIAHALASENKVNF